MSDLFAGKDASPFGRRQRRPRGARIPVTVVTGFLGSGKTTLIRELVTVVDAVAGAGNLANMPEARHQAALADRIVLTKTDLADNAAAENLTVRLHDISAAPIATAVNGMVDPDFLLDEPPDLPARDL